MRLFLVSQASPPRARSSSGKNLPTEHTTSNTQLVPILRTRVIEQPVTSVTVKYPHVLHCLTQQHDGLRIRSNDSGRAEIRAQPHFECTGLDLKPSRVTGTKWVAPAYWHKVGGTGGRAGAKWVAPAGGSENGTPRAHRYQPKQAADREESTSTQSSRWVVPRSLHNVSGAGGSLTSAACRRQETVTVAVSRQHAGNDVENVLPADSSRAVVRISHRVDIPSASVHAAVGVLPGGNCPDQTTPAQNLPGCVDCPGPAPAGSIRIPSWSTDIRR